MSEDQVRGVVVAHGQMADGLVDAVHRISGEGDALVALSNEGLGPEALFERLENLMGPGPSVVFTDLETGSCALAARVVCKDPVRRAVICGTNLPMLLDFVFHRKMPLETLVPRVVEKGKAGIRISPNRE